MLSKMRQQSQNKTQFGYPMEPKRSNFSILFLRAICKFLIAKLLKAAATNKATNNIDPNQISKRDIPTESGVSSWALRFFSSLFDMSLTFKTAGARVIVRTKLSIICDASWEEERFGTDTLALT